jgi:hypothetical protein
MVRSVAAAVLLVVFSHCGAPAQTSASARSTADRTDDFAGYQIHVMYVLPSDGIDYNLDTNGAIASSVAATQKWFAAQTRGTRRLRFDTSNGELDISFFRLARTDAAIAGFGATFAIRSSSKSMPPASIIRKKSTRSTMGAAARTRAAAARGRRP